MRYLTAVARRLSFSWHWPRVLSSWISISKVVLTCIAIAVLQNNLYGLLPCRFSSKRNKFVFSKPIAAYCIAVATIFGLFYVNHIWKEYRVGEIDQRDAIQIYCYMNVCVCLLNYVTQWAIMREILSFLNSITLFGMINQFPISLMSTGRAVMLAVLKMFGFPLLMLLTLILYQKQKQPELIWMSTGQTMIPIVLGNQLNNCFFGGIVVARVLLQQINRRLCEILREVNRLQTPSEMLLQKPYYRMQRFCELADHVDAQATTYTLLVTSSMKYLALTSFSLVISLAVNMLSTTLGCYTQYQAFADYLMLEGDYDIPRALVHFVFLVVPLLEIVLLSRVTQQVLDEAKETGNLLQRMNLEQADVRFKQVVDAFWLEVCTIQYKLMPMGLFELDGSMVSTMLAAIAGFLLFLIQNDLTLRFSLK